MFGTAGDIDRRIRAIGLRADGVETSQHEPHQLPQKQCLPGNPASTPRSRHGSAYADLAQRDLIRLWRKIIEAHAGTVVDNHDNKRRRLVEFKDGCRYGKFGKAKAYELLIAHERIRAYKMGGKTMIDLDSVDEYHASLPRVEARAS
ncbi:MULTISPECIES: hypothetical protein [unclassified Bradyrhizobium]|uniref:hypothetical protein n=1 Tax=unclassified Bradyrhizobium TaxID=2631580 RepID=UPI0033981219